jgi:hypothetical protein
MHPPSIEKNGIYSNTGFPGGASFPCIDFRTDKEVILSAVSDTAANKEASRWADRNRNSMGRFGACYVIECREAGKSKIGYSTNPDVRFRGIGSMSSETPKLVALLWSFRRQARLIEGFSLIKGKSLGLKSHGEWVNMDGYSTAAMVVEAARYDAPFIDSAGFLSMWIRSVGEPEDFWTEERLQAHRAGLPLRGLF